MVYDDWRFAGMCVKDVLEKELNLFCYAVQDMWIHKFQRNPQKLLERPKKTKKYIRRGKLIVKIVNIENDINSNIDENQNTSTSTLLLNEKSVENDNQEEEFQDVSEITS